MTPHHLHALAAAASLALALTALEQRALDAARDAEAGNTTTRDIPIPSQRFGTRRALGGHGDPTAGLALTWWAPQRPNADAALLGDLLRQLDEMAGAGDLPGAPGTDPLRRIQQAIPAMHTHIAARMTQALEHLDAKARKRLGIGPALTPLPGNPACPACRLQMLHTTAAGTIVCTADCHCTGPGCRCGMLVREQGVRHIWAASQLTVRTAA